MYQLRTDYPWLNMALLSPLLNPELEVHAIDSIRSITFVTVVQNGDITGIEFWKRTFRNAFVELRAAQIEADLMVVSPAAATFFNDPQVRQLLRVATSMRTVHQLTALLAPNRINLNRQFKRRWGRSPKEVLALFRLVWAAWLRAEGRTPAQIAHFLGFRNAQQARLCLGRKLGLKKVWSPRDFSPCDFSRATPPATSHTKTRDHHRGPVGQIFTALAIEISTGRQR
jgi:hypothetical protein